MSDFKVRPAGEIAHYVVRAWNKNLGWRESAAAIIEADRASVRAEAEAAGYQRAVGEIARWVDMEPTWVLGKDIRARFGYGGQGDE